MPSLYLGKISGNNSSEIHAFTKDLSFREYCKSKIADRALFQKLLEGRYEILEKGRPIYCTAVRPDRERRIEETPHDTREGTLHIAALDKNGEIEAALSVATDIGTKDRGDLVGLPLENRWRTNGYPQGSSLDPFREKYARLMYGEDRSIRPHEMAELYRHFKKSNANGLAARFGLYTGWYHIGVRDAVNKGITLTWCWIFDAVKNYFKLYKLVGAGVLRDFSIGDPPRLISPSLQDIYERETHGVKELFYNGKKISRSVLIPIPFKKNGDIEFKNEEVPFLDGLVDIRRKPLSFYH